MKCRHCLIEFHDEWTPNRLPNDSEGLFYIMHTTCAACGKLNVAYSRSATGTPRIFLYPRASAREPLDPAVPSDFAGVYREACDVLAASPKASSALSRRCLQHILRDVVKVKHGSLDSEIQQVLDGNVYPSHISESLDSVRTTGNFAAHPLKSTSSGEVVEVEPGEAEWNLDTLLSLFDFHFVQPAKTAARREALNKKLADAKKPPLK